MKIKKGESFWKTELSFVKPGRIVIRGYDIAQLIQKKTFGDVVYLMFTGDLPARNEGKMIEAILVSAVDHSLLAPSVDAARFVASSGVPLQCSVGAGILAIGDYHAGAIEECAKILQEKLEGIEEDEKINFLTHAQEIIKGFRERKKRIPGYGHPIHNPDPRSIELFKEAEQLKLLGKHSHLAKAIEATLSEFIKKPLPINVDGAIAAIISDMGINWKFGKGFFIISRSVGLIAHTIEQVTKERPFKQVPFDQILYTGPEERDLE